MARSAGVSGFTRAKLFVPETNIRLGAHYLAKLRTLYKGQYVPAIAAYNAGEHRVNAWLARANQRGQGGIELDRFVEEIPIEQTRNYVRRVVANWVRYRYLQDPATWPLELPARLSP
jgi:soluble lytic murein transglycosylase